ncbi:MAG TPA: FAD-binding oxidoreductase [Candidatus Limnocylindrales bacterium]|nr:FAD-binding oxidoreductase [Candidatus Limnocylindrales bacterium]
MSAGTRPVGARFADLVGDAQSLQDPAELAGYAVDGKIPSIAVRPGSIEEVGEVVKRASAEKLAIIPVGARTKLAIGLPPRQYDVALDMTRLNRVVAYDPGDLTLSVEAGLPLSELNRVLAEHRQFLPLSVPFADRATIGGAVSSGVDSPLRQHYGTARDYIRGIEFVTGDGKIAKSGGRVVKNVTGYDLHKLMIGALGTLAVITRINFRTFPSPIGIRAFVARFDKVDAADSMRALIARSALAPMTMEIFSPGAADLFYGNAASRIEKNLVAPGVLTNNTWALTIGVAGTAQTLDRSESEVRSIAQQSGDTAFTALGPDQIPGAFGRKREFIPIALASSPGATIIKLSVLPSKIKDSLVEIESAAAASSLRSAAMARAVGIIYVALLPDSTAASDRERVVRAAARIQSRAAAAGGHAVIPWCPTEWKSSLSIWGPDPPDLPQMRGLKSVFDPQGVLSPGRFVGGL